MTPKVDPETGKAKDVSLEVWAATAELEYFNKVRGCPTLATFWTY